MYLRNNPVKFHPDPIWNNRALGFFEDDRLQQEQEEEEEEEEKDE